MASGVGKTTLIGLLLKLYAPDSGRIAVNGRRIEAVRARSLRARCCVVSQENLLFCESVRCNLTLGRALPEARIYEVLRALGMDAAVRALPQGLDSRLDGGTDLSGGQKQRLLLARALLHPGALYILDEATSALDPETERAALDALLPGATAVVITHREQAVRRCNKVLVLTEGRCEAFGSLERVAAESETFAKLFGGEEARVLEDRAC